WAWEWWRAYGPAYGDGEQALRIFAIRDGGVLVGALPLYLGRAGRWPAVVRRLQFLGTGEQDEEETCSTYLDLLHLPGAEQRCLTVLREALLDGTSGEWAALALRPLADTSPLLSLRNEIPDLEVRPERPCRISDLSGGFEAYLQRLGRSTRKEF